jgi:hypothetical protein
MVNIANLQNNEEVVLKGLIEDIIMKYMRLVNLDELRSILNQTIKKQYEEGILEAERELNMNFTPDYRSEEFIKNFAFDNVTKLTSDIKENLRREVSLALMNRENTTQIRKRIREIMDTSIERAKMIQITESNRAFNHAHFQGAKESGLDLVKEWNAQPERISRAGNMVPCKHCEFLDKQVVKLDESFKDDAGKPIFLPPHHPNCACRVIYVQREDLEK